MTPEYGIILSDNLFVMNFCGTFVVIYDSISEFYWVLLVRAGNFGSFTAFSTAISTVVKKSYSFAGI